MSDKGVDLIVYLLLTLGASAIGWFKASKEKKAKNTPPEFHLPEEEHDDLDDEIVVISQEPEIPSPEPVFAPISNSDELVERAGREINVNNFGKTDEERYAMLEQLQQARRGRNKKEAILFKEEEESNEQPNNSITEHFDFDIRQAIISSEILNRKYKLEINSDSSGERERVRFKINFCTLTQGL